MRRSREEFEDETDFSGEEDVQDPKRPRIETYGFEPAEPEEVVNVEPPEIKKLKQDINLLICRYPGLQPRTSHALMEKLSNLTEEELKNVYLNCVNDVAELRGTPTAETALLLTLPVNSMIPGYTDYCMKDVELKRDIESELIQLFGWLGTKINILFRLFNNGYIVMRENTKKESGEWDEEDEAPKSLFVKPITLEKEQDGE
jgi:hypothetical protein